MSQPVKQINWRKDRANMRNQLRTALKAALLSLPAAVLLAAVLLVGVLLGSTRTAQATAADSGPQHAQAIVAHYMALLDAGMQSGDFSQLADVYAPDATLHVAGGPFGPAGKTFSGLGAITAFYQGLHGNVGAAQWTRDSGRNLAPNVVLTYEHVDFPGGGDPGFCAHVAVVSGDRLASLDWVIYG